MVLSDGHGDLGWKKFLVAGWAFVECLLFGGLLYGWASVNFVLKKEGIYADLCQNEMNITSADVKYLNGSENGSAANVVSVVTLQGGGESGYNTSQGGGAVSDETREGCKPQDNNMALCFTIASALFCVGCAVLGHINYKFGTRVTRIISFLMFVIGSLMMAFISTDLPWLMFPGLSFLGIGGLSLLVTNMQVGNLFATGSSSVVGLMCGGFDMSSSVMLLVKIAYENGFSRQNMFLLITALHLLVLISTFCFMPRDFIPRRELPKSPGEVAEDKEVDVELLPDKNGVTEEAEGKPVTSTPSLRSCLLNSLFLTHVIWLCLLQLRFYLFIGTLNQYLSRLLKGDNDQVGYFTNICFTIMMGGLITSFCSGMVYDWQKHRCKDGKSHQYRDILPAVLPLAVASGLSVLLSALVLIPVPSLLYFIFVVMTVYRSFLYSLAAGFVGAIFPAEYFGVLYGVMIICGGVFGFLQYAFFTWSEAYENAAFHVNIFLLGLMFVSFLHPVYIFITCRREERKFKVN